ncbi:hypothetical protein CU254_12705 [Amycolatopsis sp. AA4]|nr:hypothetical protein CU254_12705 [Amycolatopsis sp. AA4]
MRAEAGADVIAAGGVCQLVADLSRTFGPGLLSIAGSWGELEKQFAPDAAAAEEPQFAALVAIAVALAELELETERVAHGGFRKDGLVVLGRTARSMSPRG